MKNIAIIPARSGSKGLKDKNIKLLNKKPLIAYTIEAAVKSKIFDKIIVSTDNQMYAEIAENYGANVPFLRSKKNSEDNSIIWETVKEILRNLKEKYYSVTILQPTSPLRTAKDIQNAYSIFQDKKADSVISICEVNHPVCWSNSLKNDLNMENFIPQKYQIPRQMLPKSYRVNGAIYIIKSSLFKHLNIYGKNSYAYIMDNTNSIDIDTEFDFIIAEVLVKKKKLNL